MRDQEARGRLVHALRLAGLEKPQQIADAICTLVNTKIETSEGRHYSKHHKTPMETPEQSR